MHHGGENLIPRTIEDLPRAMCEVSLLCPRVLYFSIHCTCVQTAENYERSRPGMMSGDGAWWQGNEMYRMRFFRRHYINTQST